MNNKEEKNMEEVDYKKIISDYPWIIQKKEKIIISPDSDGFLCGLLMTNYLGSEVVGFYDDKILIIEKGVGPSDCIFIDHDINRNTIRSIGHHIVKYNNNISSIPNFNYNLCIQPNIMRNFDGRGDNFQKKYPFGTIHLLLGIFQEAKLIQRALPITSIWPLLFTDGVWINLFSYTENCIDWLRYLKIINKRHILNPLFCSNDMSFYEIMIGLNNFLRMRDEFNAQGFYLNNNYNAGGRNKRTGDKLRISDSKGNSINLVKDEDVFKIHDEEKNRIENFISSMAEYVNWDYLPEKWRWGDFKLFKFSKGDFSKRKLNNKTYISLMNKKPLSLAMTSGQNIEYTLEKPDKLQ